MQNKLHFAISGRTAAEIISDRVGSSKPNVGLTNWKNSPQGAIRKSDVVVAKNYLNEEELAGLNNIVEQYLIFAESQAKRKHAMFMLDWDKKLGEFLKLNDRDILGDLGKVSHEVAETLALGEYEKFRTEQEAIKLANETMYGLGAYVYTKDKDRSGRVAQAIESGMVSVNSTNYIMPFNPFGGYKNSGFGREHGKYGFSEVTQIKVISQNK